jgi:hypothetical protein
MPRQPATDTQALAVLRALADLTRYPFDDHYHHSPRDYADQLDAAIQAGDREAVRKIRQQAGDWLATQSFVIMGRLTATVQPTVPPEPRRR